MVTLTRERLFQIMETDNMPFYQLLDRDQVIDSVQDRDADVKSSIKRLGEFLDDCEGDVVTVRISDKPKAVIGQGGKFDVRLIRVRLGNGFTGNNQQSGGMGSIGLLSQISDLRRQLDKKDDDIARENLKRQFDDRLDKLEARYKNDNPLENPVMQKLMGLATDLLINGNSVGDVNTPPGNMPAIAGIPETAEPETVTDKNKTAILERKKAILSDINRIQKVDKDFSVHLKMFADLAERTPLYYYGAIAELQKVAEEIKKNVPG